LAAITASRQRISFESNLQVPSPVAMNGRVEKLGAGSPCPKLARLLEKDGSMLFLLRIQVCLSHNSASVGFRGDELPT
jgi:hypothetical protein